MLLFWKIYKAETKAILSQKNLLLASCGGIRDTKSHHSVGTCLRHVSLQSAMFQRIGNMPKAKALKKSKRGVLEPLETAYCGNSMQARLRAQLGDRSQYGGERRRRSVVVASIVLTITDPLRGSYSFWYYLQAALIRSCGASFACMELTTICRFQRLQASTSNHKPKGRFFWFVIYKLSLWLFSNDWKNPVGIWCV